MLLSDAASRSLLGWWVAVVGWERSVDQVTRAQCWVWMDGKLMPARRFIMRVGWLMCDRGSRLVVHSGSWNVEVIGWRLRSAL